MPAPAIFALQKTASDRQTEYPETAKAVVQKFYTDDCLDSFQSSDQALKLGRNFVSFLKLGGFQQTKIAKNVPGVRTALDPDNRESNFPVKILCKISKFQPRP